MAAQGQPTLLGACVDEANLTVSCEREGRISCEVDNGRFTISAVVPVTAEIVATADFSSTARCPGVLVVPAPTDLLPGVELLRLVHHDVGVTPPPKLADVSMFGWQTCQHVDARHRVR